MPAIPTTEVTPDLLHNWRCGNPACKGGCGPDPRVGLPHATDAPPGVTTIGPTVGRIVLLVRPTWPTLPAVVIEVNDDAPGAAPLVTCFVMRSIVALNSNLTARLYDVGKGPPGEHHFEWMPAQHQIAAEREALPAEVADLRAQVKALSGYFKAAAGVSGVFASPLQAVAVPGQMRKLLADLDAAREELAAMRRGLDARAADPVPVANPLAETIERYEAAESAGRDAIKHLAIWDAAAQEFGAAAFADGHPGPVRVIAGDNAAYRLTRSEMGIYLVKKIGVK